MAATVPGYEYDIFISYRQKDNGSDQWVTKFVQALNEELESTFKEDISVYFDENPHDGLLETHNVDKSLEGKLKCLIFLPIISQTYTDPKSFAWQHEFVAFNKLAKTESIGRDIALSSGNVASRILPIKIHELDAEDTTTIKEEIGGVLRAIEFIYKESGVNRPLRKDENDAKNLNGLIYRNQVNKVANAVRELIGAITGSETLSDQSFFANQTIEVSENSIAVLPLVNMSNDPEQEYFCDGLTEEIITDLAQLSGLMVISRSSVMTYKDSDKKIIDIAKELKVKYIIEGSTRRSGESYRISVQLIDATRDVHLWAKNYSGTFDDIFDVQQKVSKAILEELKIKVVGKEKTRQENRLNDPATYEIFLRARQELSHYTDSAFERTLSIIEEGLRINQNDTSLLSLKGEVYFMYLNMGIRLDPEYLNKAENIATRIFEIESHSQEAFYLLSLVSYKKGNIQASINYSKEVLKLNSNHVRALDHLIWMLADSGHTDNSEYYIKDLLLHDPLTSHNHWAKGWTFVNRGEFIEAENSYRKASNLDPTNIVWTFLLAHLLLLKEDSEGFEDLWLRYADQLEGTLFGNILYFISEASLGKKESSLNSLTNDVFIFAEWDEIICWMLAQGYALNNEIEKSCQYLELAVKKGFINYRLFEDFDPLLQSLKTEEKFREIMHSAREKHKNFKS